jgi:DNA-binding transcriptional LysR family regulator
LIGFDDLRLLAALAEGGTLSTAAKLLRVNHASAWRRLGMLEGRLGVRLFERERAGYVPTPAGEAAVQSAQRVLGELAELERLLVGQDVRPRGVVRLTTTDTLSDLITPILAELRSTHPGIVVELITSNVFFTLTRRDADIALRPAVSAPEGLVARRIATIATAVYAAPSYLEARGHGDVHELDWIAPDESLGHLGSARWIAAHVPPERVVHRTSSLAAMRAAALAGIGLAPLPCFMADAVPGIRQVLPPVAEMATGLWLITHPDLRRTARVRVVLDLLAARLTQITRRFAT